MAQKRMTTKQATAAVFDCVHAVQELIGDGNPAKQVTRFDYATAIPFADQLAKALRVLAAPPLDDKFVGAVSGPINSCWQSIGHDVEQGCRDMKEKLTNTMALESCLDADRLLTYPGGERGKAAEELLQRAYDGHGYDVVFKYLNRCIRLA